MVEEVIRDLDISEHVSENAAAERDTRSSDSMVGADLKVGLGAASNTSSDTIAVAPAPAANGSRPGALTPAEAIAYMQHLSLQLKDWKRSGSLTSDGLGSGIKSGMLD